MINASIRTAHLADTDDLYKDIKNGKLPAVSFVKPSGWVDGHSGPLRNGTSMKGSWTKIVDLVKSKPDLWNSCHRDLRHGGRRRRLLRLWLCAAAGFLRGWHAHPLDRGFTVHEAWLHFPYLCGPRLDPEVHLSTTGDCRRSCRPQPRQLCRTPTIRALPAPMFRLTVPRLET